MCRAVTEKRRCKYNFELDIMIKVYNPLENLFRVTVKHILRVSENTVGGKIFVSIVDEVAGHTKIRMSVLCTPVLIALR
jgi:precorrin-3B methylase